MIAYLDLIIIENFCMNFLMLYTTGKILCRKLCRWKIVVASLIGDLYTFSLYINVPSFVLNISKIMMGIVLVKISFNSNDIKNIAKDTIAFLIISFIYAGCSLAFIYLFKPKIIYIVNGTIIGGEFVFEIVLFSAIVSFVLIKLAPTLFKIKQKLTKKDVICSLKIVNRDKGIRIKAFVDTGNMLKDPISKESVIVCELEKIKELFDSECLKQINQMMNGDVSNETVANPKIREVPYSSLGKQHGLMVVYRVDYVEVYYHDEITKVENALIGISENSLDKNNKYNALIGLELFERGIIINESNTSVKDQSKCGLC